MQALGGPLALAISDDDPTSFVVRGPNWEFATRGIPYINIHVHNDSAPVIKHDVQLYTTLHVTSVKDVENSNMGDTVVVAHDDYAADSQEVAPSTVLTPDNEPVAPDSLIETTPATPTPVPVHLMLSPEQHKDVVRDYLVHHREVIAWIAPPRKLTVDLRAHLLATSNNSADRKNLALLSPAILARLADHGHISRGRKNWMRRLLRYAGDAGTREIMPDGTALYAILVRTHLGHNGHAHIVPSSMRRKISKTYMFAPGEHFYRAWVSACPGCTWSN